MWHAMTGRVRTTRAPRILHVAQPTDGGVARYVAAVGADQHRRGWEVAVACPPGGRLAGDVLDDGGRVVDWPATRSPGTATLAETRRVRQVVERMCPDVVHLHSAKAGLAGRLALRGKVPTLFQPHGWSWLAVDGATARASLAWERAALRWTDLLVCVGDGEAGLARRRGLHGPLEVVRNGVDLRRFGEADDHERAASRAALGVDPDVELAVCVGRVTRQKGQDVLVEAWARLRAQRLRGGPGDPLPGGAQLALVGDGDLLPQLRGQGAGEDVRFAGPVDDVRPWLAAADVVVLPSRWEGLSLTLLEALASGRRVVASDVPGLADAVSPEVGELVAAGDASVLAAAVERALRASRRPGARAASRAASRDLAARFDVTRTLDQLAGLTVAVADGPG